MSHGKSTDVASIYYVMAIVAMFYGLYKWIDSLHEKPKKEKIEAESPTKSSEHARQAIQEANDFFDAKNYKAALTIYRKYQAHTFFDAACAYKLGKCFLEGKNYDEALPWIRQAAEQGNSFGVNALGVMYLDGLSVNKDYTTALKWISQAAEQGNVNAYHNLGWMYENGKGVNTSLLDATNWYEKAAAQTRQSCFKRTPNNIEKGISF